MLENDKVKLLPLEYGHIKELLKISTDRSIWTFFYEDGSNQKSLTSYVKNALSNRKALKEYPFTIYDKINNQIAGSTRLYEYSKNFKTIKIGHTWLGKNFQGTDVNLNSKFLLFQFLFDELDLERIGFGVYETNFISIKALKKVGCKKEGVLRAMFPSLEGHGRSDAILFSILKSEWDSRVKLELKGKI